VVRHQAMPWGARREWHGIKPGSMRIASGAVLCTDSPADTRIDWPVSCILSRQNLTLKKKENILWENLKRLLGS
jgi:hypothetical protein